VESLSKHRLEKRIILQNIDEKREFVVDSSVRKVDFSSIYWRKIIIFVNNKDVFFIGEKSGFLAKTLGEKIRFCHRYVKDKKCSHRRNIDGRQYFLAETLAKFQQNIEFRRQNVDER
jgi:hypothetical protein